MPTKKGPLINPCFSWNYVSIRTTLSPAFIRSASTASSVGYGPYAERKADEPGCAQARQPHVIQPRRLKEKKTQFSDFDDTLIYATLQPFGWKGEGRGGISFKPTLMIKRNLGE